MKRCRGEDCKKELPLDSFSGRSAVCKVCYNKKRKQKRDSEKQDTPKVCKGKWGCGKLLPGIKFNKGRSACKECEVERMKQYHDADKQDRPKVCKGKWGCGKLLPGIKFNKGESRCKPCYKRKRDAVKRDKDKVCTGPCGELLPGKSFDKGQNLCKECRKKRKRTPEARETRNAQLKKRRKEDPQYAMRCRLRDRIKKWLNGKIKSAPTAELVGCTEKECNEWLESQFLPGMTWENRDLWHIDHMKPLDLFDALDPAEQRKACHYTNLQPLWAKDNLEQSNKDIYDMEWRDDHWHIKLGDEYVSRKEQVKNKISTHDYYPL